MKIKTKIFLFISVLCLTHSCTKKEFEGPLIETLYADFELIESLSITNKNPNFTDNEQVGFYCKFNKPVEWRISIMGTSTNATRLITGFSSVIDSNNILWNGGPSQIPFFSEEECVVELTIENEIDTIRDTINIISAKNYEDGIWVESFENGFPENGLVHYNNDGGGMTFSLASDVPLLGNYYYKMGGRVNWDWALELLTYH